MNTTKEINKSTRFDFVWCWFFLMKMSKWNILRMNNNMHQFNNCNFLVFQLLLAIKNAWKYTQNFRVQRLFWNAYLLLSGLKDFIYVPYFTVSLSHSLFHSISLFLSLSPWLTLSLCLTSYQRQHREKSDGFAVCVWECLCCAVLPSSSNAYHSTVTHVHSYTSNKLFEFTIVIYI